MSLILLAEDDKRLATLVKDYLEANGFKVVVEEKGHNIARLVRDLSPNILILDIMLPGKDGLTICKEVRPDFDGPILMLTARDADVDQVLGLDYGADDYVIKPAEPRVLLARIRALLRRYNQCENSEEKDICCGQLRIQVNSRDVFLKGEPVNLSSHEYELLVILARSQGKVLSREYLFNEVYNRPYDGMDRSVDVRVSQLRKKLCDDNENPYRIKTVWGRGYIFCAESWEE